MNGIGLATKIHALIRIFPRFYFTFMIDHTQTVPYILGQDEGYEEKRERAHAAEV